MLREVLIHRLKSMAFLLSADIIARQLKLLVSGVSSGPTGSRTHRVTRLST